METPSHIGMSGTRIFNRSVEDDKSLGRFINWLVD